MICSIVIPVHNQWEFLKICIDSIHANSHKNYEIIIIDDCSDETTTLFCKKLLFESKINQLIRNDISKGFSISCNIGMNQSSNSDYICLLNSDAKILTNNWLEKVIKIGEEDPSLGCLGVLSNNASYQSVGDVFVREGKQIQYANSITSLFQKPFYSNFINGFCLFVKTKVQKEVGLLDEKEFPHYGSEDDFVLRIQEKGYKVAIVPNVYVYHYSNQSYKNQREMIVSNSIKFLINKWTKDKIVDFCHNSEHALNELKQTIKKSIQNEDNKIVQNNEDIMQLNETCDIIIVVHNALLFTQKCIQSIKKHTDYPYNLIIVDNNSGEDTKTYLKTINAKVITNCKNYGFGYANNQAIRSSSSKYICFLNSDTIVTNNWLSRLIRQLEQENVGIVGPVTNHASSELQQINYPKENNEDSIQKFSEERFKSHQNKVTETNRLIGFCMLTKRDVLNKIGVFDDRYEFNFEDDDLGLRAIEHGYRLLCVNEVFIYHFGGQTFKDKYHVSTYSPIQEKSKELYTEKWYNSGRIKFLYEPHNKFSVSYLLASDGPSGGVKVVFEHANRLKDRGYDVKIYCFKNETNTSWFNLYVPIIYVSDQTEIPQCDIAIGTYFTTLPLLQKVKANIKIHLCQGFEALIYTDIDKALVQTIKDNYKLIKEKIVVSKWLKQIIDSEFQVNCHYISNGLDQYVYTFTKHNRNKIPRILICGNYNLEIKGVRIALQAAQQFVVKNNATIVRLASEKTKVDEDFEFHDMSKMTQDEIAKVYESCDATVCASYKVEGFSLHGLESMACGTPVITTDNGGVTDYAVNGLNAIIVPQKDIQAISQALELLFKNQTLYSKLVDNGILTAKGYLWHKQIDMLEALLDRLYQKQITQEKEQLSVCMIVKNEAQNLSNCLNSINDLANEIIVVDTGSSDDTIKIAKRFGTKIFHYDWNDDFSAARNFALQKATQPWIMIIDADEIISSKDIQNIRMLLKSEKCAYSFITRNYVTNSNVEGVIACCNDYKIEEKDFVGWCPSEKVRLFPNIKSIKFEGQIHELVEDSLEKLSILIKNSTIPIHHYGYLKRNKEKDNIYLKLGKQKAEKNDIKAIYELALQYLCLNNYDEALVLWRRLLVNEPRNYDYLSKLGTTYNLLNEFKQAEKYLLESIAIQKTEYAYKHLGICYAGQKDIQKAYETFKKIAYNTQDMKIMGDFAFCCNNLRKFDESIIILEKCLKINRKETVSWGLLEVAYNEKGIELARNNRLPQAINMFRNSLSINSKYTIASTNMTHLSRMQHRNFRR